MTVVTIDSKVQKTLSLQIVPEPTKDVAPKGGYVLGKMIRIDVADKKHVRKYFLIVGNHPVEREHAYGVKAEIMQAFQKLPNYVRTFRHSVHFSPTPEVFH